MLGIVAQNMHKELYCNVHKEIYCNMLTNFAVQCHISTRLLHNVQINKQITQLLQHQQEHC